MDLKESALQFLLEITMTDLHNFLENKDSLFTPEFAEEISEWMEGFDENISTNDKEIILMKIHENLGIMSIWTNVQEEQQEFINKIREYFDTSFDNDIEGVKYLAELVIDAYRDELKQNWSMF